MRLAVWEWQKLFRLPALWVFVGLCLVFNGLLLSSPSALDRSFFNDTSADAALLGQRVDEDFLAGLDALPDDAECVLIHDGARALVTEDVIRRAIESVEARGSGIASVPVSDTIKRAAPDGLVLDTPDRSALRAMQTPQAFRVELIRKAHEVARRDGFLGTDDAALLEHAGMPVYLCEGSRENLKLTTPTDLMLAGLILAARAEKELIG